MKTATVFGLWLFLYQTPIKDMLYQGFSESQSIDYTFYYLDLY